MKMLTTVFSVCSICKKWMGASHHDYSESAGHAIVSHGLCDLCLDGELRKIELMHKKPKEKILRETV